MLSLGEIRDVRRCDKFGKASMPGYWDAAVTFGWDCYIKDNTMTRVSLMCKRVREFDCWPCSPVQCIYILTAWKHKRTGKGKCCMCLLTKFEIYLWKIGPVRMPRGMENLRFLSSPCPGSCTPCSHSLLGSTGAALFAVCRKREILHVAS